MRPQAEASARRPSARRSARQPAPPARPSPEKEVVVAPETRFHLQIKGSRGPAQMKRSIFFLCLLVRADTLSLRNGTSISANWVSIDNREISFAVNGEVRSYPRADVWRVTFEEVKVEARSNHIRSKKALQANRKT